MPLAPGTHLGPHEIIAPFGAGGMGDLYSQAIDESKLAAQREMAMAITCNDAQGD
jgi:hypothetical protein